MSYDQEEMTGSYDEDDNCLSLNANNEFIPPSPPEGPMLHSPQTLSHPQPHHQPSQQPLAQLQQMVHQQYPIQLKQAHQQQQPLLMTTTTDAPTQQPQILAYSGPTEVVHTIEWATKPETPQNAPTHFVYIDLHAQNSGSTPELPFILSTNSATPTGAWHTNSKFLTRILKKQHKHRHYGLSKCSRMKATKSH